MTFFYNLLFKKQTLLKKMILIMCGLSITFFIVLSIFLYRQSSNVLLNQGILILDNSSENNEKNFNNAILSIENVGFDLLSNKDFINYIQRYTTEMNINKDANFDFQVSIVPIIRKMSSNSKSLKRMDIQFSDHYFSISTTAMNNKINKQSDSLEFGWHKSETEELFFHIPFNHYEENNKKQGWINIFANKEFLFQSVNENYKNNNGFYILNEKKQVIYDPLNFNSNKSKNNFIIDDRQLNNNWKVYTFFSKQSFSLSLINFFKNNLILSIILLLIIVIFASIFSEWLVSPIRLLSKKMSSTDNNKLPEKIELNRADEIGDLVKTFNSMIDNLESLLWRIKNEEELKRQAQLSAFQSQIQPHFLYNSLAIISWSAKTGETEQLIKITNDLAQYYRLILSEGKFLVSLEEELELVSYYLSIQKTRFPEQLDFEIEVNPRLEIGKIKIIHRILQPLVENAFQHGVFVKGEGTIKITIDENESYLFIFVADNGAGSEQAIVEKIRLGKKLNQKKGGFSLQSIFKVLHDYYGDSVEATFLSKEGEGSVVLIKINKKELI